MLKFVPLLLCLALCGLGTTSCTKKKTLAQINAEKMQAEKAKRKALAAKYYEELVTKYPDTEFAAQAKARLQALGPILGADGKPTPAPKKKK
jgi:outer membrane protein assembly factor BamD (BamD/ComL family)